MENPIMIRGNWLFAAALWGVALAACSELAGAPVGSEELGLRAAPADVDLDTCQATRCGDTGVEEQALEYVASPRTPEVLDDLEVRWQREPPTSCAELPECNLNVYTGSNYQIADDGSIWVAAAVSTPERDGQIDGVFVGTFGSDGLSMGGELIDQETSNIGEAIDYGVTLVSVEDRHALVGISKYVLREGESEPRNERWLTDDELWTGVREVALTLSPPRDEWSMYMPPLFVAKAAPGRLLISPNSWDEGAIALVDRAERKADWVQTREGLPPIDALVVDGDNRATIVTTQPWNPETNKGTPRIERYGSDGGLAWIRTLPPPWDGDMQAKPVPGPDGSVLLVGFEQINTPIDAQSFQSVSGGVHVIKLDSDGDVSWAIEIPPPTMDSWVNPAPPVLDDNGNIFVVGPSFSEAPDDPEGDYVNGQFVYEITPDGERCLSHRVIGANIERLELADSGDFYFFGWSFGRLMRK
jgi:hypothetical protein